MSTAHIPGWVKNYVGLRYRTGGRDRAGVDCFGLVALVYREHFGIELPGYGGPAWDSAKPQESRAVARAVLNELARYRQIPAGEEACGDGILMRLRGVPIHVGLVVADGEMLHAYEGVDACVESYRSTMWANRVLGFYRYERT